MKSIPVIEGLDNSELSTYKNFASKLHDFAVNYNNYINECNGGNNTSCDIIRSKLSALGIASNGDIDPNGALASYQNMINRHPVNDDTLVLNKNLQKKKAELNENTKILTDLDNSIEGDHTAKMKSSFNTNTILYVSLACAIYFTFFKISS
jgi:hypothetical protein